MSTNKITLPIAIFTLFFISITIGAINPALQSIAQAFPELPFTTISLLTTLPSLFIMLSTIVSGAVVGTRVSYRAMCLWTLALVFIGGIGPFFLSDFTAILVSRAVFGIGLGLMAPIYNTLIFKFYEASKVPNMMGIGTLVTKVGGISLQMLAGILASINWRFTFLVFIFSLIGFFIVLAWLPEPPKVEQRSGEKVKMPLGVFFLSGLYGVIMMLYYPLTLGLSTIVITSNFGNAAVAGTVLSIATVAGMVTGAIFGPTFKLLKKLTVPLSLIGTAIGFAVVVYASSLALLIVGIIIVGFSYSYCMPAFIIDVGSLVPSAHTAKAISAVFVAINIGGFVSTFYMGALAQITGQKSPRFPILVSLVCFLAIAVLYGIYSFRTTAKAAPPASA